MFFWKKKKNKEKKLIDFINMEMLNPVLECKCCGNKSNNIGKVDFSKNCETHKGLVLPKSDIDIYYHQCSNCGFVFTIAFDDFTSKEFAKYIYNEDYVSVDPDFTGARAVNNSKLIPKIFTEEEKSELSMIDYGGGEGKLADLLNKQGISMDTYDPYSVHNKRPEKKYDVMFSFEVAEHTPNPKETFSDMISFLNENGVIIFSTLPVPENFNEIGLNWWYAGPRNGHISFYTGKALANILIPKGYNVAPLNQFMFIVVKQEKDKIPSFAKKLLGIQE